MGYVATRVVTAVACTVAGALVYRLLQAFGPDL